MCFTKFIEFFSQKVCPPAPPPVRKIQCSTMYIPVYMKTSLYTLSIQVTVKYLSDLIFLEVTTVLFNQLLSKNKYFSSRYLPSGDLEEIYLEYYGEKRITKDEIEVCSALMLLAWIGEKIAGAELFAKYSKTSPFLMEDFHTHFQGTVQNEDNWSLI